MARVEGQVQIRTVSLVGMDHSRAQEAMGHHKAPVDMDHSKGPLLDMDSRSVMYLV